jgi:hypothetical protein
MHLGAFYDGALGWWLARGSSALGEAARDRPESYVRDPLGIARPAAAASAGGTLKERGSLPEPAAAPPGAVPVPAMTGPRQMERVLGGSV